MNLSIINDFTTWLNQMMKELEKFIEEYYSNPLLWIFLLGVILLVVGMASNSLSRK